MSSNITIPKICTHCGSTFIAKTTVTKFCSHRCASNAYKLNKKKEKVATAQIEEYKKDTGIDIQKMQSKEYLSIKETCLLLGISRTSLHRYIKSNAVIPIKLGGKVIIKRESINNLTN